MRRREFIALVGRAVALPFAAKAQQANKIPRLCFLAFDPGLLETTGCGAFFDAIAGPWLCEWAKRCHRATFSADGQDERFPALAADCLRLKGDIIVVTTTPGAHAAKSATRTIPIVLLGLGDPVATGLVTSLALPGGNVTGITQMSSGLAAKRLELLKEAVPTISRVLVLWYLVDPIAALQVRELESAADLLGVKLLVRDIRTADDLPVAFEAGAKEHAEGLVVTTASIFFVHRKRMVELAARYRLPAIYSLRPIAEAGGLVSYAPASRALPPCRSPHR